MNDNEHAVVAELAPRLVVAEAEELRFLIATAAGLLAHKTDLGRVERVFANVLKGLHCPSTEWLSLAEVVDTVAEKHNLHPKDLLGDCVLRHISRARQEAYWLARKQRWSDGSERYSLPQIGRYFSRDHATVLHGVRKHEERLAREVAA